VLSGAYAAQTSDTTVGVITEAGPIVIGGGGHSRFAVAVNAHE
jgi:hypothetical protein